MSRPDVFETLYRGVFEPARGIAAELEYVPPGWSFPKLGTVAFEQRSVDSVMWRGNTVEALDWLAFVPPAYRGDAERVLLEALQLLEGQRMNDESLTLFRRVVVVRAYKTIERRPPIPEPDRIRYAPEPWRSDEYRRQR